MTSHDQLQAVQQEIKKVGAQIEKADGELAKARADTDSKEIDFLRNSLVELRKKEAELCKKENSLHEAGMLISQHLSRVSIYLRLMTYNSCSLLAKLDCHLRHLHQIQLHWLRACHW